MSDKVYQIAVIGDSFVGKTSLLRSFHDEKFSDYHLVGLCDRNVTDIKLDRSAHKVKLIDTTSGFNFQSCDVDCFMVCYSIENRLSFANVRNKWMNIVKSTKASVVLVATKIDLRDELPGVPFLTTADGNKLCDDLMIERFIETSAKEDTNTKHAIETALKTVLPPSYLPGMADLSKAKAKVVVVSDGGEKKSSGCCGCCQS